jgi:hypothetical protein
MSEALRISRERGGSTPVLSVDLPARPAGPDGRAEKKTLLFHVLLKNIWS